MRKTNSSLADEYIVRLQNAIRHLNGCESRYLETVAISESFQDFQGRTLWEGEVVVFELRDHPQAKRAYAWSCGSADRDKATQYVVVLQIPPVTSAETAVKAAIAAQIAKGSFS
jgi:hypothetical protein